MSDSTYQQPPPRKRNRFRTLVVQPVAALSVLGIIISATTGCGSKTTSKAATSLTTAAVSATSTEPSTTQAPSNATTTQATTTQQTTTKAPAPAPAYTVAQQNAIRSAKNYLSFQAFSRLGLIDQLSSKAGDGFKHSDAEFAVNHIKVDYNQEALKAAKNYLSLQGFSRSGLISQLTSSFGDKYTLKQATYAVNHVGL